MKVGGAIVADLPIEPKVPVSLSRPFNPSRHAYVRYDIKMLSIESIVSEKWRMKWRSG